MIKIISSILLLIMFIKIALYLTEEFFPDVD